MSVDKSLIRKKLDFLNEHIHRIENMDFTESAFVENADIHDLVVFRLQQAVETAKDAFKFLGEKKIIGSELASRMGQAADFRNRVVHGYNDFDFHLLFKDYKDDIADLRQFGSEILKYLNTIPND